MRTKKPPVLALAIVLLGTLAIAAPPSRAADAPLQGNWKLVVMAFGEDEFAVFKLDEKDGKPTATVVDASNILGSNKIQSVEIKDGTLVLTLSGTDTSFKGKRASEGLDAGKFLGTIHFRGSVYPARLEKTPKSKVAEMQQSPLITKYFEAQKTADPKAKVKKLEELVEGNHRSPNSSILYTALLGSAEAADFDAEKVTAVVNQWMDEAKPYGEEWTNEVRMKALKALAPSKKFAKTTVGLALEADKLVSAEPLETQSAVVEILARSARAAGVEKLATESEARLAKFSQKLDEEYHHKVPPFKPTSYAGRQNKKDGQVVLMELFTGAECPPCVAADVAFDALLATYKPADFIGLQYHLHIPGPDPLTNRDSMARQKYYGSEIRGTPSTLFNGHSAAGGGGPMGNSEGKYTEYRQIIDRALESPRGAKIDLDVTRSGDQVKIVATGQLTGSGDLKADDAKSTSKKKDGAKAKGEVDKPRHAIRLALTEESIRYVGGNKLRFHHHVVRAFPAGAEGKGLKDGAGKIEVTLNLADLKKGIEGYLSEFTKTRPFPNALPDIKLENLAVVAFVQDDGDKSILNAVSVPVENARP